MEAEQTQDSALRQLLPAPHSPGHAHTALLDPSQLPAEKLKFLNATYLVVGMAVARSGLAHCHRPQA